MLKTALMFQDHMILQREKPVRIWGSCSPGQLVTVSIQGCSAASTADDTGCWSIKIGPLAMSFSETMIITGDGEERIFHDVQIGDVYLAAGQSNMEFFMRYDADLEEELTRCENDNIRFFDYPEVAYPGQIEEADYGKNFGFWRKACREELEWFSATAYYFAREIQEKYQIPVGILGCNWGGTPACAWMSEEAIRAGGGQVWIDEYLEGLKTLDPAAYEEQFRQNPTAWRTNPFEDPFTDMLMQGASILDIIRKLTGQEPDLSAMEMTAPVVGPKTETRPCGLYESMLTQVAPYTLRGMLFYQGESDGDRHPEIYATLFSALIRCFRDLWQEELPFLFVQVAPFGSWMASTGEPYVAIRAAQQQASETVPGTGMAVISDVGMELDIHPKKKQPAGHRLALLAENRIYGDDILCEAPTLDSARMEGDKLILHFANPGEGLYLADRTPDGVQMDPKGLGGLRILCDDKYMDVERVTASAFGDTVILEGVTLSSEKDARVELGCTGWYRINLYNSAGLPARPSKVSVHSGE